MENVSPSGVSSSRPLCSSRMADRAAAIALCSTQSSHVRPGAVMQLHAGTWWMLTSYDGCVGTRSPAAQARSSAQVSMWCVRPHRYCTRLTHQHLSAATRWVNTATENCRGGVLADRSAPADGPQGVRDGAVRGLRSRQRHGQPNRQHNVARHARLRDGAQRGRQGLRPDPPSVHTAAARRVTGRRNRCRAVRARWPAARRRWSALGASSGGGLQ